MSRYVEEINEITSKYGFDIDPNKKIYEISKKYHIPMIAGTDTHSLNNEQAEGRVILQKAKNIFFDSTAASKTHTVAIKNQLIFTFWQTKAVILEIRT